MLLQMTLDQVLCRFQAQRPGGLGRNGTRIDRVKVASCGQNIGPATRWRTARASRYETAFESPSEVSHFFRATSVEARQYVGAQALEHEFGLRQRACRRQRYVRVRL